MVTTSAEGGAGHIVFCLLSWLEVPEASGCCSCTPMVHPTTPPSSPYSDDVLGTWPQKTLPDLVPHLEPATGFLSSAAWNYSFPQVKRIKTLPNPNLKFTLQCADCLSGVLSFCSPSNANTEDVYLATELMNMFLILNVILKLFLWVFFTVSSSSMSTQSSQMAPPTLSHGLSGFYLSSALLFTCESWVSLQLM